MCNEMAAVPSRLRREWAVGSRAAIATSLLIARRRSCSSVLAAVYLPVAMTSTPSFCANCHLMKEPQGPVGGVDPRATSTASKCHVEPGIFKALEHKVLSYKEIYANFFGKGADARRRQAPHQRVVRAVPHARSRRVSPSGDIKIPHREHVEMQGLKCADCHFNVVHTRHGHAGRRAAHGRLLHVSRRQEGAERLLHLPRQPAATRARRIPTDALENHGKLARDRIEDCRRCHSERSKFCENCHSKPPATHTSPRRGATRTRSRSRPRVATYVLTVATRRTSVRSATRCSIRRTGSRRIPSSPRVAANRAWSAIRRLLRPTATSRREYRPSIEEGRIGWAPVKCVVVSEKIHVLRCEALCGRRLLGVVVVCLAASALAATTTTCPADHDLGRSHHDLGGRHDDHDHRRRHSVSRTSRTRPISPIDVLPVTARSIWARST